MGYNYFTPNYFGSVTELDLSDVEITVEYDEIEVIIEVED